MRKQTWAICPFLPMLLLMLVAPLLQAQPLLFDSPPMIARDLGSAVSPSDVRAWPAPDTPFFIIHASYDADALCLSPRCSGGLSQSHPKVMANVPDGDGYADHQSFKPDHPIDYGGF
jgi:hypothetical protein